MPGIEGREPVMAIEFGHGTLYTIIAIHFILLLCLVTCHRSCH